jgi:hypothetical protein
MPRTSRHLTPPQPKKRKIAVMQFRCSVPDRQEIRTAAECLSLQDSQYVLLCHKLYVAELVRRGLIQRDGQTPISNETAGAS